MGNEALRSCVEAMRHKPNRVCKEHRDFFSKDCAVCQLEAARNDLARTFWYVKKFCEGPQPGGSTMHVHLETPPPEITTNEERMKVRLEHILEVATTMVGRYGGRPSFWPEE
jgi:hypothetical protein